MRPPLPATSRLAAQSLAAGRPSQRRPAGGARAQPSSPRGQSTKGPVPSHPSSHILPGFLELRRPVDDASTAIRLTGFRNEKRRILCRSHRDGVKREFAQLTLIVRNGFHPGCFPRPALGLIRAPLFLSACPGIRRNPALRQPAVLRAIAEIERKTHR